MHNKTRILNYLIVTKWHLWHCRRACCSISIGDKLIKMSDFVQNSRLEIFSLTLRAQMTFWMLFETWTWDFLPKSFMNTRVQNLVVFSENNFYVRLFLSHFCIIKMAFKTPYVPRGLRWKFCAPGVKIFSSTHAQKGIIPYGPYIFIELKFMIIW